MENLGQWILPLSFIPGVGLLIMSTSNRFGQLNMEISKSLANPPINRIFLNRLVYRSYLFSYALVALYISVGSFSLGSLVGGLTLEWRSSFSHIILILTICLGVLCVLIASVLLMLESVSNLRSIKTQCD